MGRILGTMIIAGVFLWVSIILIGTGFKYQNPNLFWLAGLVGFIGIALFVVDLIENYNLNDE